MSLSVFRYFPLLSDIQKEKLSGLKVIYDKWNSRINIISRKDMDNFYIHHVLHSLSIAKIINFMPGTTILDAGTGGGFPGIPLAILFPDSEFTLLDSVEKKIKVVDAVSVELDLKNVVPARKRIEEENGKFHFIIGRAISGLPAFVNLTGKNISREGTNKLRNGIIYLKGGDLEAEFSQLKKKPVVWPVRDFFDEPFFETKVIVYLPV